MLFLTFILRKDAVNRFIGFHLSQRKDQRAVLILSEVRSIFLFISY